MLSLNLITTSPLLVISDISKVRSVLTPSDYTFFTSVELKLKLGSVFWFYLGLITFISKL